MATSTSSLDYLYKINSEGMTYAESLRRSRQYRRWQLVLGRTRERLREAEEALQIATAERGY